MSVYHGDVDAKYLARAAEQLQRSRQRSYELMRVQPGAKVADIGCGPGTDTIPLGQCVGPAGQVVGIDVNRAFVVDADARAEQEGVSAWVTHRTADAADLPLETDAFDACRSERMFQHLAQPEPALSEMVRITRPGGWVVVVDTDYATLSVDTSEPDIERRLMRFNIERLRNGYAGRQLYRLFRRQQLTQIELEVVHVYLTDLALADHLLGLTHLTATAVEQAVITEAEARCWQASLANAAAAGQFFATLSGILIAGRKP